MKDVLERFEGRLERPALAYEIHEMSDVPERKSGSGGGFGAGKLGALVALPIGKALFVAGINKKAAGFLATSPARKRRPQDRLRTRIDREKGGCWYWWEARP